MENQGIRSILNHEPKNGNNDAPSLSCRQHRRHFKNHPGRSKAASRAGIDMQMFELRFEPGPYYGYIMLFPLNNDTLSGINKSIVRRFQKILDI